MKVFFIAFMAACIITIVAVMINYESLLYAGFLNISIVCQILIGVPGLIALACLANFLWAIDSKWKSTFGAR
ncbi:MULTISPECIES: hypothetical protein [unclassified Pseudomonas]|uniref:hypothetical protein n=1 Tax=unclassified Pseudomonas TaxID=196821 RepID=UPI0018E83492|nr:MULTISPECIES: hypothetical protein [unclassified Pseudomonas]MBJ2243670.1 hypothetical protein [Pseudomonas sp. MF6768]MBJ2265222.1 hypothetical protein [Pseudomonas sp. MF6787]